MPLSPERSAMKTRKLKQFNVTLAPAHWDRQSNRIVSFKIGSPLPKRTVEATTIGEMFERAAGFADEYGVACKLFITPVGRKLAGFDAALVAYSDHLWRNMQRAKILK
jgi:hypothetical protein